MSAFLFFSYDCWAAGAAADDATAEAADEAADATAGAAKEATAATGAAVEAAGKDMKEAAE